MYTFYVNKKLIASVSSEQKCEVGHDQSFLDIFYTFVSSYKRRPSLVLYDKKDKKMTW